MPEKLLLWPNGAPGAKGDTENDKPTLIAFLPPAETATGTGVVLLPGGGYGNLATGHEGVDIAAWLNGMGMAAFLCEYRHAGRGYHHPAPLQDAQRALRMVRQNAEAWGVQPDRLGILGFSAGGHLASTTITHFDSGNTEATDPIDRQSCRPDFAVLIYPVISITQPFMHQGSRNNLLGEGFEESLAESLSSEFQVKPDTPPTFLVHTGGDTCVPSENSVAFYLACREAGVPAELHIYEEGPHGFGLGKPEEHGPCSEWPVTCENWLRLRGLVK